MGNLELLFVFGGPPARCEDERFTSTLRVGGAGSRPPRMGAVEPELEKAAEALEKEIDEEGGLDVPRGLEVSDSSAERRFRMDALDVRGRRGLLVSASTGLLSADNGES